MTGAKSTLPATGGDSDGAHSSGGPLALFEINFDLTDTRAELVKKVRWIIRVRYAVSAGVVALMVFTGWQGLTQQQALTRASLLATLITGGVAVVLNLLYFFALRRQRNLQAFVFWQLALDVLLFTSYVYRSGGVTSPFTFLYLLPVIAAAMMLSGRAAVAIAGLASLCYGSLVAAAASGVISHVSYFVALDHFARKWSYVILMLLITPVAFFSVAAVSTFLMRAVRAKTEELKGVNVVLERNAKLLKMLYAVSRSAVDEPRAARVLDRIGAILVEGLNLDRVLIYLLDEGGEKLVLEREFSHPRLEGADRSSLQVEIPLQEEAGVTARCALRRRAENVRDPAKHTLINRELARRIGVNPFAVAPMVARDELMGVLGVDRNVKAGVIDEEEFRVLIAFADQAAAALMLSRSELGRRG